MPGDRTAYTSSNARRRLLVVAAGAIIILGLTLLYFSARTTTAATFHMIEQEAIERELQRASGMLLARGRTLGSTASDWATWDDTYSFARGENPAFVDENITGEALSNLGVDSFIIVGPDGSVILAAGADPATEESSEIDREALRAFASFASLQPAGNGGSKAAGVVELAGTPMLVGRAPVLRSDGTGEPAGTLLLARTIDAAILEEISQLIGSPVAIAPTATGSDTQTRILVEGTSLVGTVQVRGLDGTSALAVSTRIERDAWDHGQQIIAGYGLTVTLVGILAIAVIFLAYRRINGEIAERAQTELALSTSEERYRGLLESMADAVIGLDHDGCIVFANARTQALTGYSAEQLATMKALDLIASDCWARAEMCLRTRIGEKCDMQFVRSDGTTVPVEIAASPLRSPDSEVTGVQWVARDVTDRKRYESELLHLASHDTLTGLYNRRRFREELEAMLDRARRSGGCVGVLWLDLDHFKELNDALGHRAGDEILSALGHNLQRRVRAGTILARLGGDEFAMVLPDTTLEHTEAFAGRLLQETRESILVVEGREVHVTPSIGVVVYPEHGTSSEELLARADLAMYRAKQEGRNRYCIYRPDAAWHTELTSRFDWALLIERALSENRMLAYAQSILDLHTGEIDRFELLVRLQTEEGEIIQPGVFLPAAERLGLINDIDRWMVRKAIRTIDGVSRAGIRLRLDVNLSGRAFADTELMPLIQRELQETGIDPTLLGLEITETAAVIDMTQACQFIETAKRLRVRVALDDFGSGFSSFYYLRNLPVDALKIDGGFIREIVNSPQDQHVVRAIVEIASGFGIEATAEYVQDEPTLALLREYGVRYAQGYHISQPIPIADVVLARTAEAAAGRA